MASEKQITFIENLLREREVPNAVFNSPQAQAVRAGHGRSLSGQQASEVIGWLLEQPVKEREAYVPAPKMSKKLAAALKIAAEPVKDKFTDIEWEHLQIMRAITKDGYDAFMQRIAEMKSA